ESLGAKTGIDENKIRQAEAGESIFKWSEYMSILFVFWNDDTGRSLIEARGLFPNALKRAMSVNRNAHEPVTEASRFGL
ncbi:MAG: hypothetical protein IJT32_07925, partial [Lachnospiraceae bacterium]|nr:hypothetical protein [Lachnospiraceae bacterium]